MTKETEKVREIASRLRRLGEKCDSGYALAVNIRYTRPTLLYQTYPADWSNHYSEKGFMLSDPVVHWGLTHIGMVEWKDLEGNDAAGVLQDARKFGLLNGLTYAAGPDDSRTIGGFTNSQPFTKADREEFVELVDDIHTMTEGFESFSADLQEKLRALI